MSDDESFDEQWNSEEQPPFVCEVFELKERAPPAPPTREPFEIGRYRESIIELQTLPDRAEDGASILRTARPEDALTFIARHPESGQFSDIVSEPQGTLRSAISARFAPHLTQAATEDLRRMKPKLSSASGFPLWMKALYVALLPLLGMLFLTEMSLAAQIICAALLPYVLISTSLRVALLFARDPAPQAAQLDQNELPIVSIVIPVYREARSVVILVDALTRLNYPKDRLEVVFLLEEDDLETPRALDLLKLPHYCASLVVPHSLPKTKPKAMNYVLPMLRGEIVGIFDAEDIPDPDQVRLAVTALHNSAENVACAQCSLNHYNHADNFLTRCAAMEYALWFDLLLTRLSWLKLPVPLGGTSLYIRTAILREVGGWDPHNVTEDADLGARLARHGYRSILVRSTTQEEATSNVKSWIKQRSRWIKGFMQTWAVHMRHPSKLRRDLGWPGFLALNTMLLDGFLAFFAQPFFLCAMAIFLISGGGTAALMASPIAVATTLVFVSGQLLLMAMAIKAARDRFGWHMAIQAPFLWVYWQLGGLAALIAATQLVTRPQHWEKTEHGLSPHAQALRHKLSCAEPPDSGENAHDRDFAYRPKTAKDRHGQPWLPQGTGGFRAYSHAPARGRV